MTNWLKGPEVIGHPALIDENDKYLGIDIL